MGGLDPYFAAAALMLAVVAWATGHAMQHSRAEWPDNKLREQRPIGAALHQQSKTASSFSIADRSHDVSNQMTAAKGGR